MKKAVCVILFNGDKILAVSRKTDHNDFGLVGGKVEDTDPSVEFAIIREAKEETGLDICNLKLIDRREYDGYDTFCFCADYRGRIQTRENHIVKWADPIILTKGSFGDYNLERFKQIGII
jgi:8-oxo-dGTP pyrophosphatase MutT (NUDIX family)